MDPNQKLLLLQADLLTRGMIEFTSEERMQLTDKGMIEAGQKWEKLQLAFEDRLLFIMYFKKLFS